MINDVVWAALIAFPAGVRHRGGEAMSIESDDLVGDFSDNPLYWVDQYRERKAEAEQYREAIREAYEIWAGSEGFIPKTAPEAYQQKIINDMVSVLGQALKHREGEQESK